MLCCMTYRQEAYRMCVHEQHLHPADLVQHLDDIGLYSFERVHGGKKISEDSLLPFEIERYQIRPKLSA